MKSLLAAILAMLLLAGCSAASVEGTEEIATTAATRSPLETAPGIYDPRNDLEQSTGGAVRAFQMGENCTGMRLLGGDILLFYEDGEQTRLALYTGENLTLKAEAVLDCCVDPGALSVRANATGVAYCCPEEKQLIQLDSQLREVTRIDLPEDLEGEPVLSSDMNFLYYCAGQEIRVLDLRAGYSRLLKSHQVQSQALLGCGMSDSVLICEVVDSDGDQYVGFFSTETGETLEKTTRLYSFDSAGDFYLLQRSEGSICEIIFGRETDTPAALTIGSGTQRVIPIPESKTALTCGEKNGDLRLDAYDLTSGRKAASVSLPGQQKLLSAMGDGETVWLLTQQLLCCWDMTLSAVDETGVYTGEYHTSQTPDTQALQDCRIDARLLGDDYGVDVLVWTDAVAVSGEYALEEEYQPLAIKNGLRALEEALRQYPQGFIPELGSVTSGGKLHICLVRSISGGFTGAQVWENGDAYLLLAIGEETQSAFHRELSHVLDTYVFGRSREYDDWESVNPGEFAYDHSFELYADREDTRWLTEEDRAFINSFAMTFPNEDRATVFEYAMGFGNEAYFQTEVMQLKLRKVCDAIRESFGWEDAEEIYPWEQYLIPAEE